ncbi:MAG: cytochrome c biogenesis protein CcdA [Candidatus Woesearchaeota archaeon]|nr:cytochrome c biogenesis protein CcdA [Candidatus Woesearchaeota archaeon]
MEKNKNRNIYFFILLGIFLSFVILAWFGYFGYLRYAAANVTRIGLLPPLVFYGFALFAGVVSFFAPCAIGILPAYLAYYLNIKEVGNKKAVYYGSFAALGLVSFYLVLGVLIIIFGQIVGMWLMAYNREISAAILIIVGVTLLFNLSINVKKYIPFLNAKKLSKQSLSTSHEKGVFFFGIFYGIEAFMCALLLMVPLIIYPLVGGDLLTSITSFVIFSLALGISMILATVLISRSRKILTEKFMASTEMLKKVAGIVMLATAAYIIYTIISLPSMDLSGMSMMR